MAPIKFSVATPGVADQLMGFYRWKLELVAEGVARTCIRYLSFFATNEKCAPPLNWEPM